MTTFSGSAVGVIWARYECINTIDKVKIKEHKKAALKMGGFFYAANNMIRNCT
jgi:hypothetical protein